MVQPCAFIIRQYLTTWTRSNTSNNLFSRATGLLASLTMHRARITMSRYSFRRHFHVSTCCRQSKGVSSGSILWRWLPGQTREALLRRTRRHDRANPSDELVYSSTIGSYAYWCQLVVYATCASAMLLLGVDAYLAYTEQGQATSAARHETPRSTNSYNVLTFFDVDNPELLKMVTLLITLCVVMVVRTVSRRAVWRIYYDGKRDAFTAIFPGTVANRRVAFLPGEVQSYPDDVFKNHAIKGMKCIILPQSFKDTVHYNHMMKY